MGKTKKLSMEQRAEYLDLCASYWVSGCTMGKDEMRQHTDDYDLFERRGLVSEDGIDWLNAQFEEATKKSDQAKRAAEKRWNKNAGSDASAMRPHSDRNASAMQNRENREKRIEIIERKKETREREVADAPLSDMVIEFDSEGNSLGDDPPIEPKPKTTRFKKPTLEEVFDYFDSKFYPQEAESFYNYYESNGWRVGKNPMKNWHASVANWIKRAKEQQLKPSYNGKQKPKVDYDDFKSKITEYHRRKAAGEQ